MISDLASHPPVALFALVVASAVVVVGLVAVSAWCDPWRDGGRDQ